eukprot:53668-Chlamydomonas_euryale.AAC.1
MPPNERLSAMPCADILVKWGLDVSGCRGFGGEGEGRIGIGSELVLGLLEAWRDWKRAGLWLLPGA